MVDVGLDSRIAEAAAAVEALRQESLKLDQQLQSQRAQEAPKQSQADDAIALPQCSQEFNDGASNLLLPEEAKAAPASVLHEGDIMPSSASTVDMPNCIFWSPAAPAFVVDSMDSVSVAALAVPGDAAVENAAEVFQAPRFQPPLSATSSSTIPWDWSAQDDVVNMQVSAQQEDVVTVQMSAQQDDVIIAKMATAAPIPPSAPAPSQRPPRPVPTRPKNQAHAPTFPSDEAVSSMSRRERIALLEQEGAHPQPQGNPATNGGGDCESRSRGIWASGIRHMASSPSLPKEKQRLEADGGDEEVPSASAHCNDVFGENSHAVERTRHHNNADGASSVNASVNGLPEEVQYSAHASGLPRRHRHAYEENSRQSPCEYPSDEVIAQMSRRERIALLEMVDSSSLACDPRSQHSDSSSARCREDSRSRSLEDAAVRRHMDIRAPNDGGSAAQMCDTTANQEALSQLSLHDGLEDEEWLEQRRQNRKLRLQQHSAGRVARTVSGGREAFAESKQIARDDSQQCEQAHMRDTETARAQRQAILDRRRSGRMSSETNGYHDGVTTRVTTDLQVGQASTGRRPVLEDLEDVSRITLDDPRWVPLCAGVASGAHMLSSGGLVRAIQVLAGVSVTLSKNMSACSTEGMIAFRKAVDAVLVSITPQLGNLSTGVVADALGLMAVLRVEEQSHLDMLLVQLLVLVRRDRDSFTPDVLASLAGSIGALHAVGVSAKRGGSGASADANRRCIDALTVLLASSLDRFGVEELSTMGGTYLVTFTDDVFRRKALGRAAAIGAGLAVGSNLQELTAMQGIERAIRQHSFAFIASLPDEIKDYLMTVKAAASPVSGTD